MSRLTGKIKISLTARFGKSPVKHEIMIFFIIILYSIVISFFSPNFVSAGHFLSIIKSSSTYMVMAIGVLIVMLSGGIDVSFSSIAAVAAYVTIYLLNMAKGNALQAFLLSALIGIILGAVNAILISLFRLPTLIVTLATSNVFFGILLQNAPQAHIAVIPEKISTFGSGQILTFFNDNGNTMGISYLTIMLVSIIVITGFILKYTSLGRNIYAMGSSMESAKRAGISIWKTQFFTYCFAGMLAGIAAIINVATISYVNPFNIQSLTMDIIAAVVLGGTSLNGGRGTITGTFLGVVLLFLIKNSLITLGVPSTWDSLIVGGILILSITFTMLQTGKKK
jgi:simple sugar transport system permease protein